MSAVEGQKQSLPVYDDIAESSEARLRDFALASADWFWEMDQDLRYTYISLNVAEIGSSPAKYLGKTIEELLGDRYDPEDPGAELLAIRGRRPYRNIERRSYIDSENWISVSGIPVFSPDGEFLGYRGATTNITERKTAEAALRKAVETANRLNNEKNRLFSIIAHDLRSPFNVLLGMAEFIEMKADKLSSVQVEKFAARMHASGKAVFQLLENLLEFSYHQMSSDEPELNPECAAQMAREAAEPLKTMAAAKDIELVLKVRDASVMANKSMVLILLRNLMTNAIKFTPSNGTVVVETHKTKNRIEYEVWDTGAGMSQEKMNSIFRLDKNVSTLGTEGEQGTGLGLVLCRELAAKLGSTLHLESVEGQGSSFSFSLPMV